MYGNLNNTDVPLNFNYPTAHRKSPRGSLSLVSNPNNKIKETNSHLFNDCVHVCGNLNNTDVPLNFNYPTAHRKSPSGSLSLVSNPNNKSRELTLTSLMTVCMCVVV